MYDNFLDCLSAYLQRICITKKKGGTFFIW